MSTNYYLHTKGSLIDRLKGEPEEVLHIGKSSGGWCFSLHVIPEQGINNLRDWYRLFRRKTNYILDEYDNPVCWQDMLNIITNRSWKSSQQRDRQFYEQNQCEPGPNGLVRHRIGNGCVAHGAGTWDLITGEFS